MKRLPLTRERVLDAALALVDAQGLSALTMRKLGAALEVEAMALYRHVGSKRDLLDGLHERVLAGVVAPEPRDDWTVEARLLARAVRSALIAHPNALPLLATRPAVSTGSLAVLERALALMNRAGLSPVHRLDAVQALFAFVVGHVIFHHAAGETEPPDYANLDPERFPEVRAIAQIGAQRTASSEFEYGLDRFLAGLQSRP